MVSFDREERLLPPIAAFARRKSYRWQRPELPFYDYRIDLFAFSRVLDLTIAIELKLTKWRRAVEQALLYQLCADRVFVALPHPQISRVDPDMFLQHGIGLISVHASGRCRQIIQSRQSAVLRDYYRSSYIDALQGEEQWRR